MFGPFKPAPHIAELPAEKIDSTYRRLRWQVFAGIFFGYAAYYFVRANFDLAQPGLIQAGLYTKAELGVIGSAAGLAYGLSKFVMAGMSDRSNPRVFLPFGLLLSGLCMTLMGLFPWATSGIAIMWAMIFLNGWFQGMGWPPCGRTMVHWWSKSERGTIVSIWNTAHNIGGMMPGAMVLLASAVFFSTHGIEAQAKDIWQQSLYYPGIAAMICAIPVYFVMRDTPQSELAAVPGTLLCGWVSDKVFKGKRGLTGFIFMILTTAAVVAYWMNPATPEAELANYSAWYQNPYQLTDFILMTLIGFLIYGPVMLIGLHALELAPKKAAGTAAGFTGLFGYLGGTVSASAVIGWAAQHYGWDGGFYVMIGGGVLAVLLLLIVMVEEGKHKAKLGDTYGTK